MNYDAHSVRFNKRVYDKKFEIIATTDVDGVNRWVTLDVCKNHKEALERVRELRGTADA